MSLSPTPSSPVDIAAFTQALVNYAEQIDDVTPLEEERDALFARITGGEDTKSLIASTINGKYFGWQVTLSLGDKFKAFVNAIKTFNGAAGDSPITFLDFSRSDGSRGNLPLC
jgi:hypothetical protein